MPQVRHRGGKRDKTKQIDPPARQPANSPNRPLSLVSLGQWRLAGLALFALGPGAGGGADGPGGGGCVRAG